MAWPAMVRRRRLISDGARKRRKRCRVCTGAERARQGLDHGFYRLGKGGGAAAGAEGPLMALEAGGFDGKNYGEVLD
jgi:hypothetical protein